MTELCLYSMYKYYQLVCAYYLIFHPVRIPIPRVIKGRKDIKEAFSESKCCAHAFLLFWCYNIIPYHYQSLFIIQSSKKDHERAFLPDLRPTNGVWCYQVPIWAPSDVPQNYSIVLSKWLISCQILPPFYFLQRILGTKMS